MCKLYVHMRTYSYCMCQCAAEEEGSRMMRSRIRRRYGREGGEDDGRGREKVGEVVEEG